jgi:FKBP-type peptidyl-prolyl cis-trans isomerase 2
MRAEKDSLLEIKYEAHVKNFSSAKKIRSISDTMKVRLGSGKIHEKFEDKLFGMQEEEEKEFDIMLNKIDQNLLITKKKKEISQDKPISEGKIVELRLSNGEIIKGTIRTVEGDEVIIDLNSPLAGKIIHFKVKVLSLS